MYEQNGNNSKEIENLKRKWKGILELKSTVTKMKNSVEGFRGRFGRQKKESVKLKLGQLKLLSVRNKQKNEKSEQSLRDRRMPSRGSTYALSEVQKEKREKGTERILEEVFY